MRKLVLFFACTILFCGCASYKFQRGKAPYDSGFLASRDNYTILEYTLGANQTVPDLSLAKERLKRRRRMVEHYYKQMGLIENRFKMAFVDPLVMFGKLLAGIVRLPGIAIADYRYEHNAKYRDSVRAREQEQDLKEEKRVEGIRQKLSAYISQDLEKEGFSPVVKEIPVEPEPIAETKNESMKKALGVIEKDQAQTEAMKEFISEVKSEENIAPVETALAPESAPKQAAPKKVAPKKAAKKPVVRKEKEISGEPVAVISLSPQRGYAPLLVKFSAARSHSPHGKIVAYEWDFGDGDTSKRAHCKNTYYSGSFEPLNYTVTLTVTDIKGNSAQASSVIEVLNR